MRCRYQQSTFTFIYTHVLMKAYIFRKVTV